MRNSKGTRKGGDALPPDHNHQDNQPISEKVEDSNKQAPENNLATFKVLVFKSHAPKAYEALIFSTWLNSLRYGNDLFKLAEADPYFKAYSAFITQLLTRPNIKVRIAVLTDEPDTALGWAIDEGNILHYIFVKKDLRKNGIGRALLSKSIKTFSHLTNQGLSIWNKKCPELRFNPFT